MGRSYNQPGAVLEHTNSSGSAISADDVVVMGDTVGIALTDIPDGASGPVAIEGVFTVAKVAGTAWPQGGKLDWDASASAFGSKIAAAVGDLQSCAVAAAAAAQAAIVGQIKLTPGTGAYKAA